jgi:hypothetical protein
MGFPACERPASRTTGIDTQRVPALRTMLVVELRPIEEDQPFFDGDDLVAI